MKSTIRKANQGFNAQTYTNAMLATGNIRLRLFISYGAFNEVFSFMEAKEVLFFQCINRFMYYRGVERQQKSFKLGSSIYYFTVTSNQKWSNKVFPFDRKTRRVLNPITVHKRINPNNDFFRTI